MRPTAQGILGVLLLAFVANMTSAVDAQTGPVEDRPIVLGVDGSNTVPVALANGQCSGLLGTLGALVVDQSSNKYILSVAHVFALNPSGYFSSGSLTPIFQPDFGSALTLENILSCSVSTVQLQSLTSKYGVANLGTVAPPDFTKRSTTMSEAVLMPVIAGKVSSNILNIPVFSGVPLTVYKKNLEVQMQGASELQPTMGRTVSKMLVPVKINLCQHQPTAGTENSCAPATVTIANSFVVKPNNFANPGDSGALILTVGPCPQPVAMLEGSGIDKNGNKGIAATWISSVLQKLQTAGGYSSLSIVPGGGGCSSKLAEVGDGKNPQTFTLQDVIVPDPDVAAALAALPELASAGCVQVQTLLGDIDGIGIDLSVSPAAIDVVFDSSSDLDPNYFCIPKSFDGVPVEQDVIQTIDADDSMM